jgi:hypothetical protein
VRVTAITTLPIFWLIRQPSRRRQVVLVLRRPTLRMLYLVGRLREADPKNLDLKTEDYE